jgi:uncharacterized protein YbaR (Trm112 family)
MEAWVRQALRCPVCRGDLVDAPDLLTCPACRQGYPVREGIPAMLAGQAVSLDSPASQ